MKRILGIIFALLVLTIPSSAQVVQPQFVRQSKGATVVALTNAAYDTESQIYDMTSFNGIQVFLSFTSLACQGFVQIYGSSEKTASTFAFSWFDATANYRVDNDFSPLVYQVTNLPPYIKFRFENFVGDSCAGGITVKFIPTPIPNVQATRGTTIDYGYEERSFPVITGGKLRYGGYNVASTQLTDIQDLLVKDGGFAHSGSDYSATGSPTAVNAVTPASVVYVSGLGQFPILQVQNVGTQDVVCGYASTTSTSQYAFKLYARTASIAETTRTVYGLGGQAYDSGGNLISRTNLYCVSATGVAGSIAIAGY